MDTTARWSGQCSPRKCFLRCEPRLQWHRYLDSLRWKCRKICKISVSRKAQDILWSRWENAWKEMFKNWSKHFSVLVDILQLLCQESGRRRNSNLIPVQLTSISRRVAKHRGRGKAAAGRKPKDQSKRTQTFIEFPCSKQYCPSSYIIKDHLVLHM